MERQYAIKKVAASRINKDRYILENFDRNKAFLFARDHAEDSEVLLDAMTERYRWYRQGWRDSPRQAIEQGLSNDFVSKFNTPPLSVDLELAAICDLACPFCFRQYIATPDKYMDTEFAFDLIDQCASLGVPSIKLNWRGEPLLHRNIAKFIRRAKEKGILEVIINTNATRLSPKMSRELIESGLDVMIYSFDGGTPKTYNKMRVGRFKENTFEHVYRNIQDFSRIREELNSPFPFTKIQMIITEDTFDEQGSFYSLFSDVVDDVSVKAYTERGGTLETLTDSEKQAVMEFRRSEHGEERLRDDLQHWKDSYGNLFIEDGRLACEQIFQRLMVSYDGRVFMCCYDWGNEHPIGFVSDQSFKNGDKDYESVMQSALEGKKGFDMMSLTMPERRIKTPHVVHSLAEIWDGKILNSVRRLHVGDKVDNLAVCKKCFFKETFQWKKLGNRPDKSGNENG